MVWMIFSFFCPTGDESLVFLLRSHFSVEHARTVGWTVAATALRQMGNVLPSRPFQPARLFHLRITNHLVGFGCGFAALCSFAAISSRSKKASALSERKVSKDKRKDTSGDD